MNDDLMYLQDLFLLSQASKYDLSLRSDRLKSVADLEKLFFRIISEIQPDLFIEAGAKDASTSRRARRHLPKAIVAAFEANPHTFARFSNPTDEEKDGIQYIHKALSDENGSLSFNVRVVDGNPSADGSGSILESHEDENISMPVTVECCRLDTFFGNGTYKNSAIWMDVEGANKPVLLGANNMLQTVKAIFIEVQDRALWENQWLTSDVTGFLFSKGFVPLARDFQSRYLYNIIYVPKEILQIARVRHFISEHFSNK